MISKIFQFELRTIGDSIFNPGFNEGSQMRKEYTYTKNWKEAKIK